MNAARVPEAESRLYTLIVSDAPQPTAANPIPQASTTLAIAMKIFFIFFFLLSILCFQYSAQLYNSFAYLVTKL